MIWVNEKLLIIYNFPIDLYKLEVIFIHLSHWCVNFNKIMYRQGLGNTLSLCKILDI